MTGETPQPARIVVADDEPRLLELLEIVLAGVASQVITAGDGEAAWRAIRTHRPDVAVLDADMPGIPGLDVARLVRAEPSLARTKLLLITGHAGIAAAAAAAGVDRSLAKPFTPADLSRTVRELLDDTDAA